MHTPIKYFGKKFRLEKEAKLAQMKATSEDLKEKKNIDHKIATEVTSKYPRTPALNPSYPPPSYPDF